MPNFISNVGCRKIVDKAEYVIGDLFFILLLQALYLHCALTLPIENLRIHRLLMPTRVYLVGPYKKILLYCLDVKGLDNSVILLRRALFCQFAGIYVQRGAYSRNKNTWNNFIVLRLSTNLFFVAFLS